MLQKNHDGSWTNSATGVTFGADNAPGEMGRQQAAGDLGLEPIPGVEIIKEKGDCVGIVSADINQLVITTDMIPTDRKYMCTFHNDEKDHTALWIMEFVQKREHFGPFTHDEFKAWWESVDGKGAPDFYGLDEGDGRERYLYKLKGRYHLTIGFILRCLEGGLANHQVKKGS